MSCITCDEPIGAPFCSKCGRAYDRANRVMVGDLASSFTWVANRARKFERQKARLKQKRSK